VGFGHLLSRGDPPWGEVSRYLQKSLEHWVCKKKNERKDRIRIKDPEYEGVEVWHLHFTWRRNCSGNKLFIAARGERSAFRFSNGKKNIQICPREGLVSQGAGSRDVKDLSKAPSGDHVRADRMELGYSVLRKKGGGGHLAYNGQAGSSPGVLWFHGETNVGR